MDNELLHYGIKRRSGRYPYGSGERPFQDIGKMGYELYKASLKKNLQSFGKDEDHNILYIDGVSGSGKSTLAQYLKEKNDEIIHLDSYFERKNLSEHRKNRNDSFNDFLKKNKFDLGKLEDDSLFKNNIKEYFKYVDEFALLSEKFGKEMYKKNKRVIMEGVQIGDETLYEDKSFYDDKPHITLTTSLEESRKRANERDLKHSIYQYSIGDSKVMNELYHHGRKGQQWGVSNGPPYPLNRKGLSYYFKKNKGTKEDRKRIKEEEETKKRQVYEEELEKNKDKILRSGKASDILKYQGRLTNKELQDAVSRLNLEKTLKDYSSKEKQDSLKKMDDLMKTVSTVTNWTNTGIKAWNAIANINNSLSGNEKKLPVINTGGGEGKKKKNK